MILFAIFLMGIGLNAFFAGYETGFVAANPIRVRHLAEHEKHPGALRLLAYMERPEYMLTLLLLGTNLALVTASIAITDLLRSATLATLVATPFVLIFGEIVPKSMFRIHPTRLALLFLPMLRFFDAILLPIVYPVTWVARPFQSLLGDETRHQNIRLLMSSVEDVRNLVDESADHGAIEPEKQQMIHAVIDLQNKQANEAMVPRIDIRAMPHTASHDELLNLFAETGLTRIPIYKETIDEVIGVVNAFDVLSDATPEDSRIDRFTQDILHVPDSMKLDDLLKTMRIEGHHMAIVTDEYGGTDGLITIEDILEEILGEIQDEFDKDETAIRRVGPRAFVVDARLELDDAAFHMNTAICDEEVDTVGGWIMHQAGRIPAKGEVLEIGRFRATILEGSANQISSIRIEILKDEEAPDGQEKEK
ncbi:MAG: hemolysin family protein [Candidatus Hydrogenedentota bacterium]